MPICLTVADGEHGGFVDLSLVRRAVVVAPHPDDETIGAFGIIRRLKCAGAQASVIIVTDGAASHPGSRKWPPDRLRKARQRETLGAMRLAGLTRTDITFLNLPDGGLSARGKKGLEDLARRLSAGPEPNLVIRPIMDDAHPDHRAIGQACAAAWPARVRQLAYRVWPVDGSIGPALHITLGRDRALKQAAMRLYRSQTGLIDDDPEGFFIDTQLMQRFLAPSEAFNSALSRRHLQRTISC